MRRVLFFFFLALTACLPERPWTVVVPLPVLRLVRDVLDKSAGGGSGHLLRYTMLHRAGEGLRIRTWDLFRFAALPPEGVSLAAGEGWELFSWTPDGLLRLAAEHDGRAVRITPAMCSPGGALILQRLSFLSNAAVPYAVLRLLDAPGTVAGVVECGPGVPRLQLLLPEGYAHSREERDGVIRHTLRRGRRPRGGEGYALLLPGTGQAGLLAAMQGVFFPEGAPVAVQQSKRKPPLPLKVNLLFQTACREAGELTPGFLTPDSGQVRALLRLADGLRQEGIPFSLVVPRRGRGKNAHLLPTPGLLVRDGTAGQWLFPGSVYAGAGMIPESLQGRDCVLLDAHGRQSGRIPVQPRDGNRVVLSISIDGERTGGGRLYYEANLEGKVAAAVRELTGLRPALEAGRAVFPRFFLPQHGLEHDFIQIKHRIPTHHPFEVKARGRIAGVLGRAAGVPVPGISLLARRFGPFVRAWQQRDGDNPLFNEIWSLQESVRLTLPRGVRAVWLPRPRVLQQGGLVYTGRWHYLPGAAYARPRGWSLQYWREWQRTHHTHRRNVLLFTRSFSLKHPPQGGQAEKRLLALLAGIDDWERNGVQLSWK